MTAKQIAKDIKAALPKSHCYVNMPGNNKPRTRIYGVRTKRDGALEVKIIYDAPGQLHHGEVRWITVRQEMTVTIWKATPMEETFAIGGI